MNKFYSSKKFKYGTAATVVTVIVVAAIVVLNVIITALGTVNGWQTSLLSQNLKLSDEFWKNFNEIMSGENTNFNIVLMMDEDRFSTYDQRTVMVYDTLKELTKKCSNIKIKAVNSTRHPELVEQYKETYGDTISITDVVFELADKDFNPITSVNTKKYTINAFFVTSSSSSSSSSTSIVGYNAEARLLSVFSQMLGKNENKPVAYYLTGHGEPDLDATLSGVAWRAVLENAGYEVVTMDLRANTFSEFYDIGATGDYNNCVVVINAPTYDLYVPQSGSSEVNEYEKLRMFFGQGMGNIIFAVDSTTPDLPHLNELMSEFGMGYGGAISDPSHTFASSDTAKILADYDKMTEGMASSLLKELFGSRSRSVPTVFESPTNVYVYDIDSDRNDTIHGYNGSFGAYALMFPYSSAKVADRDGYEECYLGVYYSTWDVNDENNTRSYAFVIGSTEFLSETYSNACMNRTVMSWMLSQIYDEMVSFTGINFIRLTASSALTVTEGAAQAWTISTIVAVPAIAITVGIIVWVRRRHS